MPAPMNQWCLAASTSPTGFGPLRNQRPSSSAGISPVTGRSNAVTSCSTGARLPARYGLVLVRGAVSVIGAPGGREGGRVEGW